jgi:hypothetical protein
MNIVKYSNEYKHQWNNFVKVAKNSHFFFYRDYIEYHSDRFEDFSLMIFHNDKLIALLPANIKDHTLFSHQGLTFGSFIIDDRMKTETMLNIFESIKKYLRNSNINKLVYKCMPYIYHIKPSQEDMYALFRHNAKLIRRDVTSTIDLTENFKYSKGRKWSINKAKKENLLISESNNFEQFWKLLSSVLETNHDAKPIHSLDEIKYLVSLFPDNIRLFIIKDDKTLLSGAIIYENRNIVHTQYLANSSVGRDIGSLDMLLDHLIKNIYSNKKYFDLGTSNENGGLVLNTGLIAQKEGFGARVVTHDFYEMEIG